MMLNQAACRTLAAVLLASLAAAVPAAAQTSSSADDTCGGVIDAWQAFAARENQGGHMDPSVFEKIQNETGRATELCQSGHERQAIRMVDESRRQHGY